MENSKIRIGKDFNVFWAIRKIVDGQRQPYDLEGKKLQLYYRTSYGKVEVANWKVNGNSIEWLFRGKEQKYVDDYELILVENAGQDGMVTVDTCNAFTLVAHSCEERINEAENIIVEVVTLESEVALAPVVKEVGGADEEAIKEIKEGIADLQQKDTQHDAKLTELSEEIESNGQLIEDLQNMKIDRENDDYYPKMAVGLADNLAGVDVVDSEINFRRSGGGAISDGVARIESIKGNSVVWNQLADSLKVYSISADANLQIPIENVNIVGGRKYIAMIEQSVTLASAVRNTFFVNGQYQSISENYSLSKGTKSWLFTANQSGQLMYWCNLPNVDVKFSSSRIYDLTKMFGAGNEPTTIEEFYARIPMGVDLNAYNEGEVIHMDVQSIESVGANQWDEEWELGQIGNVTGEPMPSSEHIRSKNYIPVIAGATYYCLGTFAIIYYDEKFKQADWWSIGGYRTLTLPQNVHYVKLYTTGTTYKGDICINLSDTSINGKYFPYIKRVEDLSIVRKYFPQGMKSAGAAHDEIRYNKASGKKEYSKGRLKSVDLGTLNFTRSSIGIYYCEVLASAMKDAKYGFNLLCARYTTHRGELTPTALPDKSLMLYNGAAYPLLGINDTAYTDAASFKAAMQGVILYYEAAEWEWVELDEADQFKDLDYQVWNAGTEKAIAEGKSAPLAADITYGFNAIGKIKELESLVAALRAKVGI